MITLNSLSKTEIENLSNEALAQRMDDIFYRAICKRHPGQYPVRHVFLSERSMEDLQSYRTDIKEFFMTKKIQSLETPLQRKILYKCFEYLLQLEYFEIAMRCYSDRALVDIIGAFSTHSIIVSSSIAFDCIMDLMCLIETGKTISSSKKFKGFKNLILNEKKKSEFLFFAPLLPSINNFRKKLRTAEIHGGSARRKAVLQLGNYSQTHEELNEPLKLINQLSSMWMALIDILNEKIPGNAWASDEWFFAFNQNNEQAIQDIVSKVRKEML